MSPAGVGTQRSWCRSGQYFSHFRCSEMRLSETQRRMLLTFRRSSSFVVMTMIRAFSCQMSRQKSTMVLGRQPCSSD